MENLFGSERRSDYVPIGKCRTIAGMGEEIAAEEGLGRFLEQNPRFPVVRNVRSIDMANTLAAEIEDFAISQFAGRSITQIVKRNHAADCAMRDLGTWRGGEEFIHRPALVRLHVSEGDPPESRERNDARYRLGYERKHSRRASVEEERIVGVDEELIEREPARRGVSDTRREPVDTITYFVCICLHSGFPFRCGNEHSARPEPYGCTIREFNDLWSATTLDAVAREVGVSKTALCYYYPSKDALLFELVFGALQSQACRSRTGSSPASWHFSPTLPPSGC